MLFKKDLTIVANWKMNPNNYNIAQELFNLYAEKINCDKINLIVAPPAVYLKPLTKLIKQDKINISLSAQNICWEDHGAFTGEISANMVKDIGCNYTIIGHSECRKHYKETDKIIAKKFLMALQAKLIPIVCVGENKSQFDKGEFEVERILYKQLKFILKHAIHLSVNSEFIIAYEPVWSIGTGLSANPQYINQTCGYIHEKINHLTSIKQKIKVLYGGSVNISNVKSILQLSNVDGVLVGGASLNAQQFSQICQLS